MDSVPIPRPVAAAAHWIGLRWRNAILDTKAAMDARGRYPMCKHDSEGECDACFHDRLADMA